MAKLAAIGMASLGEMGGYDGGHRWLTWLRLMAMLMDIGGLAG